MRWVAVGVLVLASALNYLDRQILSALAPTLIREFSLTPGQFGLIISSFSLVYALSSPLVSLAIDAIGLRWGAAALVGLWSLAGMSTGAVNSFGSLLVCRGALGFAESGGIPASGKTMAVYLYPRERPFGAGLAQVGITLGLMGAPLAASWLAEDSWRTPFVVCGALGLAWAPVWLLVTSRAPRVESDQQAGSVRPRDLLRDTRFWVLLSANALAMSVYSLWTNWTTYFLVSHYHLDQNEANRLYAWIPPIFATAGGLFGGWLALRGMTRLSVAALGATLALACAAAPWGPTPAFATGAISLSLFGLTALSVNYYTMPLDFYGAGRAAFSVSSLTSSYGLMQTFLAPAIGDSSLHFGWAPVCAVIGILPVSSVLLLRFTLPSRPNA